MPTVQIRYIVRDVDATIKFYTTQLGFQLDMHPAPPFAMLSRGDLRLVASDGRASSDSVVIHAADRPFLGAVVLRVSYPWYLGRAPENLPVGEPMRLPRGTVVDISGRA